MSKLINTRNRKIAVKLALLMGAVLMLVGPSDPGYSDDTFLFRVQSGKPYLQIMFDTSSSMNLSAQMGGTAVASSGDSPLSTFYQAKSAVFEVFDNAHRTAGDFIHYGFYSYNQDGLRVRGKHWLYQVEVSNVVIGSTPFAEAGEVLVFGAHLPNTATPDAINLFMDDGPGVLGSCTQPVDLAAEEPAIHRFPKLHPLDNLGSDGMVDDMDPTTIWIEEGGEVYRLDVSTSVDPVSGDTSLLNQSTLFAEFTVTPYFDCSPAEPLEPEVVQLSLIRPFLMHDLLGADNASDIVLGPSGPSAPGFPPSPPGGGTRDPERQDGLWNYQDYTARAVCGDDAHPFTGVGFEGNYDGGTYPGVDPTPFPNVDPFRSARLRRRDSSRPSSSRPSWTSIRHRKGVLSTAVTPSPFTGLAPTVSTSSAAWLRTGHPAPTSAISTSGSPAISETSPTTMGRETTPPTTSWNCSTRTSNR
jgi:hypothetical protein